MYRIRKRICKILSNGFLMNK